MFTEIKERTLVVQRNLRTSIFQSFIRVSIKELKLEYSRGAAKKKAKTSHFV